MKSLFLTVLLAAVGLGAFAQKVDKAKDLLSKKKLAEAKAEIDGVLANEKNKNSSEAWYVKASVYNEISKDPALKATVPDAKSQAFEALKTYVSLEDQNVKDSTKRYIQLNAENKKPLVDIYSNFFQDASTYYNAGNYNDALTNFQNSMAVFDLMSQKGFTNQKLDTLNTLYAGIAAEKANKPDEAAKYYSAITANKAKGEGFNEIYKWVANYYQQKGDEPNAAKYLALGKEVYPNDPFWPEFELETLSGKSDRTALYNKYEELIKANPDSSRYHFNYAVELYKDAYNDDTTKRPENSKELIDRAVSHLQTSIQQNGEAANAHFLLGQIYFNQGNDINNYNKTIRPKTGAKLSASELKKKEDLRTEMNKKFDDAIPEFEKLDGLIGSKAKLKAEDKNYLKNAYDNLITIYELRQNREKADLYTEKFNNVDKVH
jgi:hypothetical protein